MMPRKLRFLILLVLLTAGFIKAQDTLPIRGFSIAAPEPKDMDAFIKFIDKELAPRNLNTLVLRVDYNYQYQSHPEISEKEGLSKDDIKKLVNVCWKHHIRLIPQINLLGHQSWAEKTGNLLRVYPEFDETPHIKMPEKYVWPNPDALYCKSYCPLHPGIHKILFELIDEICDDFKSDAFHAGMDEVFYIGHESCPRCSGRDKAELFANEVNTIRNHLAIKNRQLWIWGDRLIDGKTTGMGMWEASMNNTYRAIGLISKDVMICDWHYERPDQTAVYFAMKGFSVITCPWRNVECAIIQTQDMFRFRQYANPDLKNRYQGMIQTVWSDAGDFLKEFYDSTSKEKNTPANCFRALFGEINKNRSK